MNKLFRCGVLLIYGILAGCSYNSKLCSSFTDWVEPARADYFSKHRVYPLSERARLLAEKYEPKLVIHPAGNPPISFDDYFENAELVFAAGDKKGDREKNVAISRLSELDYATQCSTYIVPARENVISKSPYPWYVQSFVSPAPGELGKVEDWLYLKYNLMFDWSGLANELSRNARAGVRALRADANKWHRLDVHTAVIIAIDNQGRQRLVAINQHNYVRTYIAGRDFNSNQRITIAAALRSNELYLDNGAAERQKYRVVTFYNNLPYLINGKNKPNYSGIDEVAGANAGGVPVETRLVYIEPNHPLASYSGLLAPPKPLLGGIYIGRDGPMGYDYYSPPSGVDLGRMAAMGYWREGDDELADELRALLKSSTGFRDSESLERIINTMEVRLEQDLNSGIGLCEKPGEKQGEKLEQEKYC